MEHFGQHGQIGPKCQFPYCMTLHLSISSPDAASAIEFFQCIVFLHQNILDILLHNLDDHSTPWCKISIAIPIYLECNLSLILEEILTFQLYFLVPVQLPKPHKYSICPSYTYSSQYVQSIYDKSRQEKVYCLNMTHELGKFSVINVTWESGTFVKCK